MRSDLLASIMRRPQEERVRELSLMNATARAILFAEMAADPEWRISDIIALGRPWADQIIAYVVGDPQKGIPPTHRTTYVGPNPAWSPPPPPHVEQGDRLAARDLEAYKARVNGPPMIEIGTFRNQRRWTPIDRPQQMPAERAYLALSQWGSTASDPLMKGRLIEMSESEYLAVARSKSEQISAKETRK